MEKLIIGIDLCDNYTQAAVLGREDAWMLPTVICRKKSAEEWYVGEDAYKYTLVGEGVIVDKLLSLAAKEGTSTIGGVKYGGMELLQRFLGSILAMVRAEYAGQKIDELVISLKNLEMKLLEGLTASVEALGIPRGNVHIASHTECFVYYVLNQKNDNPGTITVKGGTFVNYDPSKGDDNLGGSFVADGYSVVSEKHGDDTWYTVVKGTGVIPGTQDDLNNAITDSTNKDITVVMPADQTLTLDNGIANEGAKARNITFVGDGTQTVDVITNATGAEGGQLNYQRGSTFTFENVTVQAGEGSFDGIVCDELVYRNCTIKGKLTLYGKATFINCTFDNTMANQYSIWTWGGTDVTFEGCTFNTNGKAILLYGQATAANPTNLVVNNCTFNDRKSGAAGKAAIEVGNDYNATYTLTVNHATVNGFAAGKNTGSHLWANKNSMDAAHLTVTIDGAKVQ